MYCGEPGGPFYAFAIGGKSIVHSIGILLSNHIIETFKILLLAKYNFKFSRYDFSMYSVIYYAILLNTYNDSFISLFAFQRSTPHS